MEEDSRLAVVVRSRSCRRKRCIVVGVWKDLDVRAALHPSQTCATHLTVAEAFARDKPARGAVLTGRTLEKCVARRELELAGEQPKSWQTIHRRIRWDAPAPTLEDLDCAICLAGSDTLTSPSSTSDRRLFLSNT